MISDPILSQRIKHYRKLHSMTQEELAAKIGVAAVHIVNIERGRKGISLDKLILICKYFNVSLSDIFPIDERDDSEWRGKLIDEILGVLNRLDTDRLEIIKMMVSSL